MLFSYSLFHLAKGSQHILKRVLQRVRTCPSSLKVKNVLLSLRSSNSSLRLLPHVRIPSIFPSVP